MLPIGNAQSKLFDMDKVKNLNLKIKKYGISKVAALAGLNKSTLSRYVGRQREYSLENFEKISTALQILETKSLRGRTSAHQATQRVYRGEDWRIAYFDFVDSLLATQSELLIQERPVDGIDIQSLALICAIVMQLCDQLNIKPPDWAQLNLELTEPWFISKFKNLRAISLMDSPIFFKRNNIFVGEDFLHRK